MFLKNLPSRSSAISLSFTLDELIITTRFQATNFFFSAELCLLVKTARSKQYSLQETGFATIGVVTHSTLNHSFPFIRLNQPWGYICQTEALAERQTRSIKPATYGLTVRKHPAYHLRFRSKITSISR